MGRFDAYDATMLFTKKENPTPEPEKPVVPENSELLIFTHDEINLMRECMKRTEDYYKGLLLLKQDWNPEKNEDAIAFIKVKLRMIDALQEKTLYAGQPEYYREMQ